MSKIEQIYTDAFNGTAACRESDRRLSDIMQEQVFADLEDVNILTRDECERLAFDGSCYGQAEGFACGFRYAVGLILECMGEG